MRIILLILLYFNITLAADIFNQNSVEVFNSGIQGNNTQRLLNRLDIDCLNLNPDLVILMVGTNDFLSETKYLAPSVYESNLDSLVKQIISNSCLILMTIPPVNSEYFYSRHPKEFCADVEERIVECNNIIYKVAKKYKVKVIDVWDYFNSIGDVADRNSLFRNMLNCGEKDGVHLTVFGNKVLATIVYSFIKENNYGFKRIVCFGDSITYGAKVNRNQTYPAYLSELVR